MFIFLTCILYIWDFIFCNHFQMHSFRHLKNISMCNIIQGQSTCYDIVFNKNRHMILNKNIFRTLSVTAYNQEDHAPKPLRSVKPKSRYDTLQHFVDIKQVKQTLFSENCIGKIRL